jgi:hypothetical protein
MSNGQIVNCGGRLYPRSTYPRPHSRNHDAGNPSCRRTFPSAGHYGIYQLEPADHITAGFSVECGSDAAALRAARTLLERSAGVEVWKSADRLVHLRWRGESGCRARFRGEESAR